MIRSIDHVLEVKRDGVVEVAIVGDAGIPNDYRIGIPKVYPPLLSGSGL